MRGKLALTVRADRNLADGEALAELERPAFRIERALRPDPASLDFPWPDATFRYNGIAFPERLRVPAMNAPAPALDVG